MRSFGIGPVAAVEQAQRDQTTGASEPFQKLPQPTGTAPYRARLADLLGVSVEPSNLMLHVFGDHGGVKDPHPQAAVAQAMVNDRAQRLICAGYTLGDVVYFNGVENEYGPQFYEPYSHYNVPVVGIPGNHDGDPEPGGESSLEAFMANFCSSKAELPARWAEFQRTTQTQPNCFWTLESDHATIIGLYSNVPSGGEIMHDQEAWLASELAAAPKKPLIVALHHPPYSIDAHHGGSARMGEVLDRAFDTASRCPDLVLSGHVHDYQRFTRTAWGKEITYVVAGNGGYHNLHGLAPDAAEAVGKEVSPGVVFDYGDASSYGFLRLAVLSADGIDNLIRGEYVQVGKDGTVTDGADVFTITPQSAVA